MTRLVSTTLAGATIAFMISIVPVEAHQPGAVHCTYAKTKTAHAICASKRLKRLDSRINDLYGHARSSIATREHFVALHDSQRAWATKRDRCGGLRFCIWLRTKQRIRQLRHYVSDI